MQSSHTLDQLDTCFDDTHAIANAGLLLPATLAERLGIQQTVDQVIDLGERPGAHRPGGKLLTLVHAMLAGGDCIDDADLLRCGATSWVLGHRVMAPSTLGTFLRAGCSSAGPLGEYRAARTLHLAPDGRLIVTDLGSGRNDGAVVAVEVASGRQTVLMRDLPSTRHSGQAHADLAGPSGAAMGPDGTVCAGIGDATAPNAGFTDDRPGPCQRFARNYATRSLTPPYCQPLDSGSHLRGCVGR